jgi:hypothetical protein
MTVDYRATAFKRAHKHGVPYAHRVGKVVVLVTKTTLQGANKLGGDCEAKVFPSSGHARDFVERAVRESGWKTVES